jgi:hypothetical protein
VAPLRYGAGIKGKVVSSLAHGVPCVATAVAVEGMGITDGQEAMIAHDPAAFAEAVTPAILLLTPTCPCGGAGNIVGLIFDVHHREDMMARIQNIVARRDVAGTARNCRSPEVPAAEPECGQSQALPHLRRCSRRHRLFLRGRVCGRLCRSRLYCRRGRADAVLRGPSPGASSTVSRSSWCATPLCRAHRPARARSCGLLLPGLSPSASLVHKKSHRHGTRADNMEGVNDVVEAELYRRLGQTILSQFAAVERATCIEKLARPGRGLLVDPSQMFAEVPREGSSEILKEHAVVRPVRDAEQRFGQCEFVRGDIPAEQDNCPPVGVERRSFCDKIDHRLGLVRSYNRLRDIAL